MLRHLVIDGEPLDFVAARTLIRQIRVEGTVTLLPHAALRGAQRQVSEIDVDNVLRGGTVKGVDPVGTAWRYRVETQRFVVVVEFEAEDHLLVVTAWRVET